MFSFTRSGIQCRYLGPVAQCFTLSSFLFIYSYSYYLGLIFGIVLLPVTSPMFHSHCSCCNGHLNFPFRRGLIKVYLISSYLTFPLLLQVVRSGAEPQQAANVQHGVEVLHHQAAEGLLPGHHLLHQQCHRLPVALCGTGGGHTGSSQCAGLEG